MNSFYEFEKKSTDGIRRRVIVKDISEDESILSEKNGLEAPKVSEDRETLGPSEETEGFSQSSEETKLEEKEEEAIILTGTGDRTMPSLEEEFETENFQKSRKMFWVGITSGILCLALAAFLASTVFARLTIIVKPRLENVTVKDVTVKFDSSVSKPLIAEKVIPAEHIKFSKTIADKFESTGREIVEEKARGNARLYNSFSSSPQRLVATTRFLTDDGILFRLQKSVIIPGAKIENGKIVPESMEVELIADKPGEESNINRETTFRIPGFKRDPKYQGFYAITSNLSGGFKGEARVVSADDIKRAEELVTKRVFDELKEEIKRKIPPGFVMVEGLREIEIAKINVPRPKMRLDVFPAEVDAKGHVLVFRERDLQDFLKGFLIAADENKKLVDSSMFLNYTVRNTDIINGRAEVALGGEVKIKSVVSNSEIIELLRGKKEDSIAGILKARSELAAFRVAIFPPWIFSAPQDPAKIKMIVEGE